ncbi:glycosyltransferase, partial [Halomonas sp. 11-S5]|uniref:glycosyltransferase n=1 Tax=Halomonas sp. 11-S5 TaxID=2994064 RepID=UPI00246943C2
ISLYGAGCPPPPPHPLNSYLVKIVNMKKKNAIIVCRTFSKTGKKPWLFDDLSYGLISNGLSVLVLLFDISGEWGKGVHQINKDLKVVAFPVKSTTNLGKVFFHAVASFWLYFSALKACGGKKVDVMFTSSVFSLKCIFYALDKIKPLSGYNVGFLWDFFPIHHEQIGFLSARALAFKGLLKNIERFVISCQDCMCFMSDANLKYFLRYHIGYAGKKSIVYLWSKNRDARTGSKNLCESDYLHAVFGGQLTSGRGVEDILKAGKILNENKLKIKIHVYGAGDLANLVEAESLVNENVVYHGVKDRKDYLSDLKWYDIGLVVTVPDVNVPTFPSKVLDYFISAIPVVASVEQSSDFGDFVQYTAKAGIRCDVGSPVSLVDALLKMKVNKERNYTVEMGRRGRIFFDNNMEVAGVVNKILEDTL